jgi:hypothetical protein
MPSFTCDPQIICECKITCSIRQSASAARFEARTAFSILGNPGEDLRLWLVKIVLVCFACNDLSAGYSTQGCDKETRTGFATAEHRLDTQNSKVRETAIGIG